tara:strand:+ start:49 stop:1299 length:1251 start_codon:yes stop_codon:yes gene_type:complete
MTNPQVESTFDLNVHVARLLMNEPFFAALSRRVDKRSSQAIPTAAVLVNPYTAQFEMLYNPNFFEKLTDAQRRDIIKHELYHIIFEHLTGRRPEDESAKIWNFATDLAINSHLQDLPEGCLKPEQGEFADYPRGMSAEWYLAKLKENNFNPEKNPNQSNQDCDGEGTGEGSGEGEEGGEGNGAGNRGQFDSHDEWGKADATTKEMAKERLKDSLRKAAEESSRSNNWGSIPSELRKEILKRIASVVDWKKVLRYFVKTSQKANKSTTIKRINRRYPYIHPGRKTQRQAKIAISIDQSGSVSDEMLASFFAELNKLSDLAEFTVIPFDCTVAEDKVYTWKKGEKRKWERVRYGGTDFNPPTDYVNDRGFDGHIVLTDLCAPKPKPSKCQRMWMTTEYYARNPYFKTNERIIAITEAA